MTEIPSDGPQGMKPVDKDTPNDRVLIGHDEYAVKRYQFFAMEYSTTHKRWYALPGLDHVIPSHWMDVPE